MLRRSIWHFVTCLLQGLPKTGFPLIFHGSTGQEMQEANSPSFFNPMEITDIKDYVQDLMDIKSPRVLAKDNGIISPYHQQVKRKLILINLFFALGLVN